MVHRLTTTEYNNKTTSYLASWDNYYHDPYYIPYEQLYCLYDEIQHDDTWLVNKTFVSRDLAYDDQHLIEAVMIELLKRDVLTKFADRSFDEIKHQLQLDIMLSITGPR